MFFKLPGKTGKSQMILIVFTVSSSKVSWSQEPVMLKSPNFITHHVSVKRSPRIVFVRSI